MKKKYLFTLIIILLLNMINYPVFSEDNLYIDFNSENVSLPKTIGGEWSIEKRAYITYADNSFDKNGGSLETVFGIWNAKNGKYVQTELSVGAAARTLLPETFSDFSMEFDAKPLSDDTKLMVFFGCVAIYDVCVAEITKDASKLIIGEKEYTGGGSIEKNKEYHIKFEITDNDISLYLDNELIISENDLTFNNGRIGFGCWNSQMEVDNFKVTAPDKLGSGKKLLQKSDEFSVALIENMKKYPSNSAKIAAGNFIDGEIGIVVNADEDKNGYYFGIDKGKAFLRLRQDGNVKTLSEAEFKPLSGTYYKFTVNVSDTKLDFYIDNIKMLSAKDDSAKDGMFGIFSDKTAVICENISAEEAVLEYSPDALKDFSVKEFKDIDTEKYSEAIGVLTALEIVSGYSDNTFRGNEKMTRAEFADAIYRIQKLKPANNSDYNIPEDISEDCEYRTAVIAAVNDGYLKLYNNQANPDDAVELTEALDVMLRILGAKPLTQYNSILSVADSFNITDNVNAENSLLTRYGAAQLIFNTMNEKKLAPTQINSNGAVIEKNKSILEELFDVQKVYGILKANKYINAFSKEPANLSDNEILIDSNTYICNRDVSEFVGCGTVSYVQSSDDVDAVIYIKAHKTSVTQISAEKINENTSNSKISYYKHSDSDKSQSIRLNDNTKVVYNGLFYNNISDISENIFNIKNGTLTVIDNNNDSDIDFVFVNEYSVAVVESVSYANSLIYDRISKNTISTGDIENKVVIKKGNNVISINEIKQNDVLCVQKPESENGYTVITVSEMSGKSGVIKVINEKSLVIDNDEFDIADILNVRLFNLNDYVTAYFDFNGKIVYMEKRSLDDYGYLVGVISDEEELYIKMFTTGNGKGRFILDDKVNVYNNGNKIRYIKGKTFYGLKVLIEDILDSSRTYDNNSKPEKYGVLVRYKIDSDNKVYEIHFQKDKTKIDLPDDEMEFSCYYDSEKAGETAYYYSGLINSKYRITQNTKIISLSGNCFDMDNFKMLSYASLAWDEYYDSRIYDVNEEFEAKVLVIYDFELGYDRPVGIIQKSEYILDENDNASLMLTMYQSGETVIAKTTDYDLICDDSAAYWFKNENTKIKDLKPGDIIIYNTDSQGYINWYALIFKNKKQEHYATSPRGWYWGTIPSTDMTLTYTDVTKKTGNIFVFDSNNYSRPVLNNGGRYYLYNSNKNSVIPATFDDVKRGDNVTLIWKSAVLDTVVIYR